MAAVRAIGMGGDKNMKVKMYSTEWCTACKQARKWLEEKGVEVEELDIMELPGEWQSVPVFYIGGDYIIGFNRRAIEDALWRHLDV